MIQTSKFLNIKLGWVLKNKNPTTFFTHPSIVRLILRQAQDVVPFMVSLSNHHDEVPSQEGTFQIPLLRGARGVLFIAQRKKIEIPIHQVRMFFKILNVTC